MSLCGDTVTVEDQEVSCSLPDNHGGEHQGVFLWSTQEPCGVCQGRGCPDPEGCPS